MSCLSIRSTWRTLVVAVAFLMPIYGFCAGKNGQETGEEEVPFTTPELMVPAPMPR